MIIMWAFAALVAASAAAASRDDGRENAGERAAAALVDGLSPLEAALLRAVAQMGAALDETDQRLAAFLSFDGGGELLASLDATMALLKGEVLALTAFALKQHLAAAIETCTDDPEASFTLFKEAHLVIKRLVRLGSTLESMQGSVPDAHQVLPRKALALLSKSVGPWRHNPQKCCCKRQRD